MEDFKMQEISVEKEYNYYTFMNPYTDGTQFYVQKKENESDFYLSDEREEKIDDIFKNSDIFKQNQSYDDFDFDEKQTLFQTNKTNHKETKQKIIKKIFVTQKINKKNIINKKGRRNLKNPPLFKPKHHKNSSDNIYKKIKRQFIKSVMKYINELYSEYLSQKNKKPQILVHKVIPKFSQASKKENNKKYLSMTLRELLSSDLSGKFTQMDKKYNKKKIDILIQENKAKEIIKLLNKTIKEVYEIYINNKINEFSLDNDLKEIEKENGIEDAKIFEARAKKLIENP